jgi:ADP-dependent NAD(P)H-hydrate dehydratase / NAD(P)H-hydrate epimerase
MWVASPRPLSSEEMAVVEQNAVALGVSLDTLMENAGRAVAEEAIRRLPPPPARVAIVASTGNNGGDGTCAAHYLAQWGYAPEIWLVRPPAEIRSRPARRCFERIERKLPVHARLPRPDELAPMPMVIDALLGTGQSDRLRAPVKDAVDAIRASGAPVLSIDLPTGSRDPDGLRPRWTVALTSVKSDLAADRAGQIVVREIGIPPEAWRQTGPGEFAFFRPPTGRTDRGRNARVVVIGGGPYTGAPALAALAALRTGAERATVIAPAGAAERIQTFSPNLVVRAVGSERFRPADVKEILDLLRSAPPAAVILGMGAGAHAETVEALGAIEGELAGRTPLVVDADGLSALPAPTLLRERGDGPAVIATPNLGELDRLVGPAGTTARAPRATQVAELAASRHLFLLAKGEPDLLSDGTTTIENRHHHPAMTVSGVGDVLAGAVGSLLGQQLSALAAARLGAYWVGEAGILAASRRSFGLVATDVIDELPAALAHGLARLHRAE